ncbi:ribosomal protein S18-alanine N-acetyltransferase [Tropicibacter naphthalenivorans]|uniref:[Ribosomal protein bS18]-alanine N-acetyltransferase n=1 Tax=Tropicibacter naphthalenivorans TaxID=441103 RepID=A0A0P1GG91_9RHOB|nr:ribosomal protein S18-alanine N-acetyltransferase [Tropicibacter naphthalenivorans]CUH75410.1 ribosomal-protein-alanine N-acetyltransferase [Tropicibacter naphthalenivorans]SMC44609.1 ribosomal-protein-alanine N-acetyltransferase [Tropicibacter naphthalenivorans]
MTPEQLADISARAYVYLHPWSAGDFADTLARPIALLTTTTHAFVLGQVIVDEAEILALATDPDAQGRGEGRRVLTQFERDAQKRGAASVFLEVAAQNAPARALYTACGYRQTGLRKDYYNSPLGGRDDAILMSKTLP